MPSFYVRREPKARKQHQCIECGGDIQPGEKYVLHVGIWEGDFDRFKQCEDCALLFIQHDLQYIGRFDDRVCFGELGEAIYWQKDPDMTKRFEEIRCKRSTKVS